MSHWLLLPRYRGSRILPSSTGPLGGEWGWAGLRQWDALAATWLLGNVAGEAGWTVLMPGRKET